MNRALRAVTIGVLLLSPVVLSACSAGQVTQTATQERDKVGAQAQVGDISVREGELLPPRGGSYQSGDDAELRVALVNGGTEDDTLVSVDGEGFASAEISSSAGASSSGSGFASSSSASSSSVATSSAAPTSGPSASTPGSSSGAATSSAAPTAGAAPTSGAAPTAGASTSSSSSSGPSEKIVIPAGQTVFVGGDAYTITLTDLDEDLTPGQYIQVTLTFQKAGEITIPVTVANPTSSVPRTSAFNFNQEEGGSGNAARSSEAANK